MEVRSCDLVKVPRDRRCRLWPWNFDAQTQQYTAAVFTMFDVDDLTDPLECTCSKSEENRSAE